MKVKIGDTGLEVEALSRVPDLPGLHDAYRSRETADALRIPAFYMGIANERVRAMAITVRFRGVVKTDPDGRLHVRRPAHNDVFISGSPQDLMRFPKDHWKHPGRERYLWYEDPGEPGVRYGFLASEA